MFIDGKWYSEPGLTAYINELKEHIRELEETLAHNKEEEYD